MCAHSTRSHTAECKLRRCLDSYSSAVRDIVVGKTSHRFEPKSNAVPAAVPLTGSMPRIRSRPPSLAAQFDCDGILSSETFKRHRVERSLRPDVFRGVAGVQQETGCSRAVTNPASFSWNKGSPVFPEIAMNPTTRDWGTPSPSSQPKATAIDFSDNGLSPGLFGCPVQPPRLVRGNSG